MTAKDLSLNEISIGDSASFNRTWIKDDVETFAKLSGDANPLHMDENYARTTRFGRPLVHGMLIASACSALVGMYLPGKRCLYLSQEILFIAPVFIGDTTTTTGTVTGKSASTGILEIAISITKNGEEVIHGTARVQVL